MVAVMDQVEVTEDSEQHERYGQFQSLAGEFALYVRRKRVERIGNHRRSRDDADKLIQKVRRVVRQDSPVVRGAPPRDLPKRLRHASIGASRAGRGRLD